MPDRWREMIQRKRGTLYGMGVSPLSEADLGMFSMFGRTGTPTKRGPTKAQFTFFATW